MIFPNLVPFKKWDTADCLGSPGQTTASSFKPKARSQKDQSERKERIFFSPHLCEMKWNNQVLLFRISLIFLSVLRTGPKDTFHLRNKKQDLDSLLLCWVLKNKTKHAYTSNTLCSCNLKLLILIYFIPFNLQS